jgi:hypothetical protein
MTLNVNSVETVPNLRIPPLKPQQEITVNDYRFQKQNHRTKYNYAPYKLKAGADLPSINDKKLIAGVDEWFTNGPTFTDRTSRKRIILFGTSIIASGVAAILALRSAKKRNNEI